MVQATRRTLRFEKISDVLDDVDRIVQSHNAGTLKPTGNWTPAEILSHVAAWIEYGYNGYPMGKPFFLIRWVLRLSLKKMLRDGMSPGVRLPGVRGGTFGAEQGDVVESANRLKRAFERLGTDEVCPYESPGFGPMSHADRIRLNLQHAALHLSFLSYPNR